MKNLILIIILAIAIISCSTESTTITNSMNGDGVFKGRCIIHDFQRSPNWPYDNIVWWQLDSNIAGTLVELMGTGISTLTDAEEIHTNWN